MLTLLTLAAALPAPTASPPGDASELAEVDEVMWDWAFHSPHAHRRVAAVRSLWTIPNQPENLPRLLELLDYWIPRDDRTTRQAHQALARENVEFPGARQRTRAHYEALRTPSVKAWYLKHSAGLGLFTFDTYPAELLRQLDAHPAIRREAFRLGLLADRFRGPLVGALVEKMATRLAGDGPALQAEYLREISWRTLDGRALEPLLPAAEVLSRVEEARVATAARGALHALRAGTRRGRWLNFRDDVRAACRSLLVK